MKIAKITIVFLMISTAFAIGQEKLHHDVISRIKEVGFQQSQILETLSYIADVYGPRLSGTPAYLEAAEWAKKRLQSIGLENVRFDSYEAGLRGWAIESYSIEMVEPRYMSIIALPSAWTAGTEGEITGVPVLVDYNDLDALKKLRGQLRGKILMSPISRPSDGDRTGPFTDTELDNAAAHTKPNNPDGLDNSGLEPYAERLRRRLSGAESEQDRINRFLIEEGVAAVIRASRKRHGVIDARQLPYSRQGDIKPVPHFIIAKNQHGRMMRMMQKGVEPKLRLHLKTTFYTDSKYHVNILGEISGHDKKLKDQIVLVGGHFDSYHSGTGAADNGAGCATVIEALRILKKIGVKPRRTIRIALWGGEEQGHRGSLGYIKKYVGDILAQTTKDEHSKISVYFNHDNNGHNIRGIFAQGNEAIRPIFEDYLKPFHYMGAKTVTIENAGGTDHLGFDAMNIPAFEWIQDPMHYFTHQIHTSMDVLDLVTEDSLKRNAVIIATFVYQAAMRDEMMPRKRIN